MMKGLSYSSVGLIVVSILILVHVDGAVHKRLHHPRALPLSTTPTNVDSEGDSETADWCDDILSSSPLDQLVDVTVGQTALFVAKLRVPAAPHGVALELIRSQIADVGGTVVHFGTSALLIHAPYLTVEGKIARNDAVRRHLQLLCPLKADYKMSGELRESLAGGGEGHARKAATLDVDGRVVVDPSPVCVKAIGIRSSLQPVPDDTANMGSIHEHYGGRNDHFAAVRCCEPSNSSCLAEAAQTMSLHPSVYFVERYDTRATLHNKFSRGLMQSGVMFEEPFSAAGIMGSGHVVGVADTGIDHDHCFFYDPANPTVTYDTPMPRHRKLIRYARVTPSSPNSKNDFKEGHGTHVAGTVAGQSIDATADAAAFHGIAPLAKVSFMDLSSYDTEGVALPPTMQQLFQPALQDGARIHSNSWGSSRSVYSTLSQEVDMYVATQPDFLVVFSAGNEADKACEGKPRDVRCDRFTVSSPSTNKNGLSIGASMAPLPSWELAAYGNFLMPVRAGGTLRKSMVIARADFGPKEVSSTLGNVTAVWAAPGDSCGQITNDVKNRVVFTLRGVCHFEDKAKRIQAAGGVAMIVVNTEPGDPFTMGSTQDSHAGNKGVEIPSFMISKADGALIQQWLTAGIEVLVSLLSSSANDPKKDPENLSSFSSHGPTSDYRFKPDIVAIGEFVHSAYSDNNLETRNCDLWPSMGTSMSCPLISGTAVLLREYFMRGFYATGAEGSGAAVTPSAALLKATLVHAARPLHGIFDRNTQADWLHLGPTPSFEQGHGIPNLNSTLPVGAGSPTRFFFDQDSSLASTAQKSYCVHFRGAGDFRAVIAWTDPASSPTMKYHLINNLDLIVTAPDGRVFHGNVPHPNTMQTDVVNNVEKVTILASELPPTGGHFIVTVRATHVQDRVQNFALVASGELANACEAHCDECVNGACQPSGLCECEWGYTGANCDVEIPTLSSGETVTLSDIMPMEWRYLRIRTTGSQNGGDFQLTMLSLNKVSDPDLYVVKSRSLPSFLRAEEAVAQAATCNNCGSDGPATPRAEVITFADSAEDLVVGVVSMCCYNSSVKLYLTGAPTATASIHSIINAAESGAGQSGSSLHRVELVLPLTRPFSVGIHGRFLVADHAEPVLHSVFVTVGRTNRLESPCSVTFVNSSFIRCSLVHLPLDTKHGDVFAFRVNISGKVSVPDVSVASLVVRVTGSSDPHGEPTASPSSTGPASSGRRLVVAVSNIYCSPTANELGKCNGASRLVLPATAASHPGDIFLLGPANMTAAERGTVAAISILDWGLFNGDNANGTSASLPQRSIPCVLRANAGRTFHCSFLATVATGAFAPSHVFGIRVELRDGSVENVPLEVVSIVVMPNTVYHGLLLTSRSAPLPDAAEAAAAKTSLSIGVAARQQTATLALYITGANFLPSAVFPGALPSAEFSSTIVAAIGTSQCATTSIVSGTLIRCYMGSGVAHLPANVPQQVHLLTHQLTSVPPTKHLTITFAAEAHAIDIVGVRFDKSNNVTRVDSLTLNFTWTTVGAVNVTVTLREVGVSAPSIDCEVLMTSALGFICQVSGSYEIPRATTVWEVTVALNNQVVLDRERIALDNSASRTRLLGVGLSNSTEGSAEVSLPPTAGDDLNPVGATLRIFAEGLPHNSSLAQWRIELFSANGADVLTFACLPIAADVDSILCSVSPYAFGTRSLRVFLSSSPVPLPSRGTIAIHAAAAGPPDIMRSARHVLSGVPLVLGATSSLAVTLRNAIPAEVHLSTTGCATITPLAQFPGAGSSRFVMEGSVTPAEPAAELSVCVAPLRTDSSNNFFFEVLPRLSVWSVTSLALHVVGESTLAIDQSVQGRSDQQKPRQGFSANDGAPALVVRHASVGLVMTIADSNASPHSDELQTEFQFAFSSDAYCGAAAHDEYATPVYAAVSAAGVAELKVDALPIPDGVRGLRTLCVKMRRPSSASSSGIAVARLNIVSCQGSTGCSGHGKCVRDESASAAANATRCACEVGFGRDDCSIACPWGLSSTSAAGGAAICASQGNCNAISGSCDCSSGFAGPACQFLVTSVSPTNTSDIFPRFLQHAATLQSARNDHSVEYSAVGGGPIAAAGPSKTQSLIVLAIHPIAAAPPVSAAALDVLIFTHGASSSDLQNSTKTPLFVDTFTWTDASAVGDLRAATSVSPCGVVALSSETFCIRRVLLDSVQCRSDSTCFVGISLTPSDQLAAVGGRFEYHPRTTEHLRPVIVDTSVAARPRAGDPSAAVKHSVTGLQLGSSSSADDGPLVLFPNGTGLTTDGSCDRTCAAGGAVVGIASFLSTLLLFGGVFSLVRFARWLRDTRVRNDVALTLSPVTVVPTVQYT